MKSAGRIRLLSHALIVGVLLAAAFRPDTPLAADKSVYAGPAADLSLVANSPGAKARCIPAADLSAQLTSQGYGTALQAYSILVVDPKAAAQGRAPDPDNPKQSYFATLYRELFYFIHPERVSDQMLRGIKEGTTRSEKLQLVRKFFAADMVNSDGKFTAQKVSIVYSPQKQQALVIGRVQDFNRTDYTFDPLPNACIEMTIYDAHLYDYRQHAFAPPPPVPAANGSNCDQALDMMTIAIDCTSWEERQRKISSSGGGLFIQGRLNEQDNFAMIAVTLDDDLLFGDLLYNLDNRASVLDRRLMLLPLPPATVQLLQNQH